MGAEARYDSGDEQACHMQLLSRGVSAEALNHGATLMRFTPRMVLKAG